MEKSLNIGILSTCSIPGDVKGNLEQIEYFAKKAGAVGCDCLLTPELSVSGYGGYDEVIATAEPAGKGYIYERLSDISAQNKLVVMAGFAERGVGCTYLSHYAVYPDGSFIVQRKHRVTPTEHPFTPSVPLYYDNTEEIGHVNKGEENFCFFFINNVKCAIIICADMGIRHLWETLVSNNVNAVFVPVGAGGVREDKLMSAELITKEGVDRFIGCSNNPYFYPEGSVRDAIGHNMSVTAVNMCGFDGREKYHGGSGSSVDAYGIITAHLGSIELIDRQRPTFAFGRTLCCRN